MFEVSSDIYFVVYNLYYVDQNDDLEVRAGPIHRDGGSTCMRPKSLIKRQPLRDNALEKLYLKF
jgi:hypothetical protein